MENKKVLYLSSKKAKNIFATIGLGIVLYILGVLYLPYLLDTLFKIQPIKTGYIIDLEYLYFGIKFMCIVIGSIVPFLFITFTLKIKPKEYFRTPHIRFVDLFLISAVLISFASIIIFILTYISSFLPFQIEYLYPVGIGPGDDVNYSNLLYMFLFIFVSPFIEEVIFRGVLLRALGRFGNFFGIVATSSIFALCNQSISQFVIAIYLSAFLSKIVLRYKSIVPAIFMHILFNGFFLLLSFIPNAYLYYYAIALAIIYLFALFCILFKRYPSVKIQYNINSLNIFRLFFTRLSIMFSILLAIALPFIRMLFEKILTL